MQAQWEGGTIARNDDTIKLKLVWDPIGKTILRLKKLLSLIPTCFAGTKGNCSVLHRCWHALWSFATATTCQMHQLDHPTASLEVSLGLAGWTYQTMVRKNWTFLRFLYIFVHCLCALVWEMTLAGCIFFLREMGETTQDFHLQLCITQLQKVHLAIKFSDFLPVSSPLFWVISFRYHLWCTTSLHLAGFTGKQHWIVICSNFKATYFTSSKPSGMSRCWRNNTTLHDVLCLETWMDACILLYWPMDEWSRQKHEDIVASAFLPLSHKSLQFKFGNEQNITKLPRGLGLGMLRAHPKTFSISPWSAPQNWDLLSPERP